MLSTTSCVVVLERQTRAPFLEWRYAAVFRQRLGYPETIRQLEQRLLKCHPDNRRHTAAELELARKGKGPTVLDWLVEIIGEQ